MLYTTHDPRAAWYALPWYRLPTDPELPAAQLVELPPEQDAVVRALPAGAREAPLAWACDLRHEQRTRFDLDSQDEVVFDVHVLTGWRARLDPRLRHAGSLSFTGLEALPPGFLQACPPAAQLGPGVRALSLDARHLRPDDLRVLGARCPWQDLAVRGPGWTLPRASITTRELADAFPHLLGLELHGAPLSDTDLDTLAKAHFTPRLLDLSLPGARLPEAGATALFDALGALEHLDLRDTRLGPSPITRLAPHLRGARRLQLSDCPLGDTGLEALLGAGALDAVEDLWLSRCELTDRAASALAQAPLRRLRGLWIDSNHLTDPGVEQLTRAPWFTTLEGAYLYQRGLGDPAGRALDGHPLAGAHRQMVRRPGVTALWFMGRVGR